MKSTDQVIEYWLLKLRKRQLRHAGILKKKFRVLPKFAGAFIFNPELHVAQMLPSLTK